MCIELEVAGLVVARLLLSADEVGFLLGKNKCIIILQMSAQAYLKEPMVYITYQVQCIRISLRNFSLE